jgi:integrase
MATLELDPASKRFRVRFRYGGQEFKRSLRTKQQRIALASLGQVEEVLRMLELGMVTLPPDVDEGAFIVSGARVRKAKLPATFDMTLQQLLDLYEKELPEGAKEERTLAGERLHFKHLLRHLKGSTKLSAIKANSIQRYVELRSQDEFRGRSISPNTIKKELTTLRLVWNWAKAQEYVPSEPPLKRVIYPKRDEKSAFMTMKEIHRLIERGSIPAAGEAELWESLYLMRDEVESLLQHVTEQDLPDFVYPMFVLVAHTGMRRSELLRAQRNDFDFEGRTIAVREKKRSRKHALSYRRIPMTGLVSKVFQEHFAAAFGSEFALHKPGEQNLAVDTADYYFEAALKDSPWEQVRGFHVFRHSFASNAAAEGVDQRMIDSWMGHQTEEMQQRYRHLAPDGQQAAIDTVFRYNTETGEGTK